MTLFDDVVTFSKNTRFVDVSPERRRYIPVLAVRLATEWFRFSATHGYPSVPLGTPALSFREIRYWEGEEGYYWPTTHPSDLERLYTCIVTARLEGKI